MQYIKGRTAWSCFSTQVLDDTVSQEAEPYILWSLSNSSSKGGQSTPTYTFAWPKGNLPYLQM